jgi:two-component system capsular synthesis response regulator RcsB
MKKSLSNITLAIMAPTPLTQNGVMHFLLSLVPSVLCMVTASSLKQLLAQWEPEQASLLVAALSGSPEEITHDTQLLLQLSEHNPTLHIIVYTFCRDVSQLALLNTRPQISLLARQESYEQTSMDMALALTGIKVCSPSIRVLLEEVFPRPLEPGFVVFTQAERQVLKYLLQGMSPSDIAKRLHRSIKTISAHKCNSMRKLGVRNDSELFRNLQHQMVTTPFGNLHSPLQDMKS